jgi:MFS family permease
MTAHPKFISYVGLIAPPDKKALYQGYAFLYGVIGSGIGGILGATLYVHFVDKLHQPEVLWFIFSLIGVATMRVIGPRFLSSYYKKVYDGLTAVN